MSIGLMNLAFLKKRKAEPALSFIVKRASDSLNNSMSDRSEANSRGRQNRKRTKRYSRRKLNVRSRRLKRKVLFSSAESRLKQFRQASVLAVAMTGFIILLLSLTDQTFSQVPDSVNGIDSGQEADAILNEPVNDDEKATDEAFNALENLWDNFTYNYPKILIAIGCLFLAWLFNRLIKLILGSMLKRVPSASGIIIITTLSVWLLAIGVAFSVVAGDFRALVGSFGLVGLALSWALQTPIESFTGYLLNSFRGYYNIGDRIRVGEVFGDVYKIDFLSTTVWEIGSPYQPGFVNAEQSTGRLVTFPNNEILTGTVINLTGDFPFVWDEIVVVVANESDISYTMKLLEEKAKDIIGDYMQEPAKKYTTILRKAKLEETVPEQPQVYVAANESWTDLTIRYLVAARERRKWKTILQVQIMEEFNLAQHKDKIIPVYPRQQIQIIDPDGIPTDPSNFRDS